MTTSAALWVGATFVDTCELLALAPEVLLPPSSERLGPDEWCVTTAARPRRGRCEEWVVTMGSLVVTSPGQACVHAAFAPLSRRRRRSERGHARFTVRSIVDVPEAITELTFEIQSPRLRLTARPRFVGRRRIADVAHRNLQAIPARLRAGRRPSFGDSDLREAVARWTADSKWSTSR